MYWALLALASIIVLVLVVTIIGYTLPKGHVATRTVRFSAPPQAIWNIVTDYPAQPAWRTGLKSVERTPDQNGHEVWREVSTRGDSMPLETLEAIPPKKLIRKIADPKMPFGGTWTYEFTPDGTGTRLTITERGEVYNPIFRVVSRFTDMRSTIDQFLTAWPPSSANPSHSPLTRSTPPCAPRAVPALTRHACSVLCGGVRCAHAQCPRCSVRIPYSCTRKPPPQEWMLTSKRRFRHDIALQRAPHGRHHFKHPQRPRLGPAPRLHASPSRSPVNLHLPLLRRPCDCVSHDEKGPMKGAFSLVLTDSGPSTTPTPSAPSLL